MGLKIMNMRAGMAGAKSWKEKMANGPPHFAVSWSPDSKWIQTYICDLRKGQKMYLLDWSVDTLYRQNCFVLLGLSWRYRYGLYDAGYFNIETGGETVHNEFRNVNQASFEWSKSRIIYCENYPRVTGRLTFIALTLTKDQ